MNSYERQYAQTHLEAFALLSDTATDAVADDFEDRYQNFQEGDGSVSDEWRLYLQDIGGYQNFPGYAAALTVIPDSWGSNRKVR